MKMRDIATQLRSLKVEIFELFLVYLILNSLPPEYEPFKVFFNIYKKKWLINKFLTCVQEDWRLKHEISESIHYANHAKWNAKKGKGVPWKKKVGVQMK